MTPLFRIFRRRLDAIEAERNRLDQLETHVITAIVKSSSH